MHPSWWSKTKDFFRNIKLFLRNFYEYIPILWNDRDWDHDFLLRLLRHKLIKMRNMQTGPNALINEHDRRTKKRDIGLCINLINRLLKDDYCDLLYKKHREKYGSWMWRSDPKGGLTVEESEEAHNEFSKIMDQARYLREQDKEMLFKIMNKKIDHWWD